ncbi:MAG: hypothetical protein U9O98_08055 [Asgard group archaeon]|nr:hypothetical protein [Asgard group archaeon]
MSEEEYYKDILSDDDEEEEEYPEKSYTWGSEPTPPPPPPPEDKSTEAPPPPQEEFYGEGYYQDYQYQPTPEPSGDGTPWFWIGVFIGLGVSAIVMIIFNFVGAPYNPLLAFIEIVLLLTCTTLPGLFIRKIGKGILGGLIVFGVQFFVPLIIFYISGQNPAAFYSPYFISLNALGFIREGLTDFFGFSFIPLPPEVETYYNQYANYTSFIWLLDLVIMFGIILMLVIFSSWLFGNMFTEKAKNFWTWFLLPFQAIVIILNLFVIPWALLCTSHTTHMAGALAAGAGNVAEVAMPFAQGNTTGFDSFDPELILQQIDRADYWFDIAQKNFRGLNSLYYMRFLHAVSGRYGFLVSILNHTMFAGFELLAAIQPIAHGTFENTNMSGVEVDGLYYQVDEFMEIYDTFSTSFNTTSGKPSESMIDDAEIQVDGITSDLDYLLINYFDDALEHLLKADEILNRIDPDEMRNIGGNPEIESALNDLADQLENITEMTNEYRVMLPFAIDLLDESPHMIRSLFDLLIGNVRLVLGYQFDQAQQYLNNATTELDQVTAIFTPETELEMQESETAIGFYSFFEDLINLMYPIIAEEGYISGSIDNTINALDEFHDEGTNTTDIETTNYVTLFNFMGISIENSDNAVTAGSNASAVISTMNESITNDDYSIMTGPANNLLQLVTDQFQPEPFAEVMYYQTLAINDTFAAVRNIANNDSTMVSVKLDNAIFNIDEAITITEENPNTPVGALKSFLESFRDAILGIKNAVDDANDAGLPIDTAIPSVNSSINTLYHSIHNIVDEGLPP